MTTRKSFAKSFLTTIATLAVLMNGLSQAFAEGASTAGADKPQAAELPSKYSRSWKVELPRADDIERLDGAKKLSYFNALQTLMEAIEAEQDTPVSDEYAAFFSYLVPRAEALPKVGGYCPIGGYIGKIYKTKKGRLSCGEPDTKQLWDGEKFFCGPKNASRSMAYCNSASFLYTDGEGGRSCQPTRTLSQSCGKVFKERYSNNPDLLNKDFQKLIDNIKADNGDGKAAYDKYIAQLEKNLNIMVKQNDFRKSTANVVLDQIQSLKAVRNGGARAVDGRNGAAGGTTGLNYGNAGQAPGTIGPAAPGTRFGTNTNGIPADGSNPGAPTGDGASAPSSTAGGRQMTPDEAMAMIVSGNINSTENFDDKALGDLKCVVDGLKASNPDYKPSARYIALIAAGVQAFGEKRYDTKNEVDRKALQANVISHVQAYGFCDEASYGRIESASTASVIQQLVSPSEEARKMAKPQQFFKMATGKNGQLAAETVYGVFGISDRPPVLTLNGVMNGMSTLFAPNKAWDDAKIDARQSMLVNFRAKNGSAFALCQANAIERAKTDKAFNLSVLSGNSPVDGQPSAEEVSKANLKVCESMVNACGVDVGTCAVNGLRASEQKNITGSVAPAKPAEPATSATRPSGGVTPGGSGGSTQTPGGVRR